MARSRRPVFAPSTSPMGAVASACFNIKDSNTANFRSAYRNSTSNIAVAFMGDSTMRGVDEGAQPYNYQYSRYAMPMKVADALVTYYGIPSSADNWYGISGTSLNDYVIRDSRITTGGTAAMGSSVVQGGTNLSMSSATATMTFTPVGRVNTADIYTLQNSAFNGSQLSWKVDGGAVTNITQDATNTIRKTTIPLGALDLHTIGVDWVSGSNGLFGIEAYDGSKRQLIMRQWGISGGTASDMVLNTGTPSGGRLQQLTLNPPKLVICEGGVVNSWRNSTSVASVTASLQSLITAVKAAGSDFIFLTPPYDGGVAGLTSQQDDYVKAMYSLAASNDVGLIDIRKFHLSYRNAVTSGWMRSNDAVHLATQGYYDEADIVAKVIVSLTF